MSLRAKRAPLDSVARNLTHVHSWRLRQSTMSVAIDTTKDESSPLSELRQMVLGAGETEDVKGDTPLAPRSTGASPLWTTKTVWGTHRGKAFVRQKGNQKGHLASSTCPRVGTAHKGRKGLPVLGTMTGRVFTEAPTHQTGSTWSAEPPHRGHGRQPPGCRRQHLGYRR